MYAYMHHIIYTHEVCMFNRLSSRSKPNVSDSGPELGDPDNNVQLYDQHQQHFRDKQ